MHAANRSHLIAGVSALTVGALVTAPGLLSAPDVQVPAVKVPVALAASPIDVLVGLATVATTAGQTVAGGVIDSADRANALYSADTIFIGSSLSTQLQSLIANPSTIPATIAQVPGQAEGLVELVEQQSTGVSASGAVDTPLGTGYTLPGIAANDTFIPAVGVDPDSWIKTFAVKTRATTATLYAATMVDDAASAAGLPKLANPIVTGASEVGTSLIQAQGLIRSASVSAVQNTITAATDGKPSTRVSAAVVNGIGGVTKSVFGDSSVPKVTPNPFAPGLGFETHTATDTVSPVARLGAIRTVTSTVTKAVKGVAGAV